MKTGIFLILLCPILFLSQLDIFAYEIVTLKSKDVSPYNQALDGFKNTVDSKIVEYTISSDSNENKAIIKNIMKNNPDLILTIGVLYDPENNNDIIKKRMKI